MFLAYDGIVFDVLLLNHWEVDAVMSDDGADFLYWHHLIDITAVINPAVNATIFFPPVQNTEINRVLRSRQNMLDTRLKSYSGQTGNDARLRTTNVAEQPNKTPIITSDPPVSAAQLPKASGIDTHFYDDVGTSSEHAGTAPSYPPATTIGKGVRYDPRLGQKTGPINEPLGGNWYDTTPEVAAAPASLEGTYNNYSDNAPNLIEQAIQFVKDVLLGGDRPIPPPDLPGPPTTQHLPPPPGKKTRFPGNANFPASDNELRDRLEVPRRKLMVWINSGQNGSPEFILNLPYDGCACDAKHGPKCLNASTIAVHGNVTGVKRLMFECHEALPLFYGLKHIQSPMLRRIANLSMKLSGKVNPSLLVVKTPPLISNRWEMRQIPNPETYLNSTVISGKAIFRMDVLGKMEITADQLRPYIMPPVPIGYVRRPPEVALGSGGNEVTYTIVDDQQMMNNPSGQRWGVHSVEVIDSVTSNNPIDAWGLTFAPERK